MKKNSMSIAFFITGTGTGVGKTFATACLSHFFISRGFETGVVKPFQTGTETGDDDIAAIKKAVPGIRRIESDFFYRMRFPASPQLAAQIENIRIDPAGVLSALGKIRDDRSLDVLLVEGAGGLCVPVCEGFMMMDFIRELKMPAVLVCDSGLGTINHTFLSVKVLKAEKIECAGFIFNKCSENPDIIEKDNLELLKKNAGIPFLGTIKNTGKIMTISSGIYSFPGFSALGN